MEKKKNISYIKYINIIFVFFAQFFLLRDFKSINMVYWFKVLLLSILCVFWGGGIF